MNHDNFLSFLVFKTLSVTEACGLVPFLQNTQWLTLLNLIESSISSLDYSDSVHVLPYTIKAELIKVKDYALSVNIHFIAHII